MNVATSLPPVRTRAGTQGACGLPPDHICDEALQEPGQHAGANKTQVEQ
jgi:hypothetical protein